MTLALTLASAASETAGKAPLGGHLWHVIEALGFLITSLGGIAVAEFIQARQRRVVPAPLPAHSSVAGSSSSVAVLERTEVRRADATQVEPATRQFWLPLVAFSGAAAAAIHFVVMPDHFEESWLYGGFFLVAAVSQIIYSLLVLARPSRALLAAGAIGNAAIVVLWIVTRTAGIPVGPAAGSVESVGGLDVLCGGFEVVTALATVALLWQRNALARALRPATWSAAVTALIPCAVVAIAVTAYLSPPS